MVSDRDDVRVLLVLHAGQAVVFVEDVVAEDPLRLANPNPRSDAGDRPGSVASAYLQSRLIRICSATGS